ncbi:MAG: hypothetical protein PHQ60_02670 [Sideroxydans sp.]|nr:hypothetical protein [Sideroxydans sp.]
MQFLNAVIPAQAGIQTKNKSLAQQGQNPRHVELIRLDSGLRRNDGTKIKSKFSHRDHRDHREHRERFNFCTFGRHTQKANRARVTEVLNFSVSSVSSVAKMFFKNYWR